MSKRVTFASKPGAQPRPAAEEWVSRREIPAETEERKRLTIDVSKDLHTAIKTECARRGVKMADEIRLLLESHFLNAETLEPEIQK